MRGLRGNYLRGMRVCSLSSMQLRCGQYFVLVWCFNYHFVFQVVVNNGGGLSESEKKEKRALEKKLSEMEEELKVRI